MKTRPFSAEGATTVAAIERMSTAVVIAALDTKKTLILVELVTSKILWMAFDVSL